MPTYTQMKHQFTPTIGHGKNGKRSTRWQTAMMTYNQMINITNPMILRIRTTVISPSALARVAQMDQVKCSLWSKSWQATVQFFITINIQWQNLLPQKFEDSSEYWHIYLSSAPRIWAPTPVNLGPCCVTSNADNFFLNAGFSTEYIKQKLCFCSGIETLKYQPSKNFRVLPSKWYLIQIFVGAWTQMIKINQKQND